MAYLTYTMPTAGVHPRLWISDLNGPTVASVRARATGTHASYYAKVKQWYTQNSNANLNAAPSTYTSRDQEFVAGLAFVWLVEGNTTFADKAIQIALYYATLAPPSDNYAKRRMLLSMALVYDWCYSRMTPTQRTQLIEPKADGGLTYNMDYRCNQLGYQNPDEYMWGHSHGNHVFTMGSLCAIVQDSADAGVNAKWQSWLEAHLDAHDNGTNTQSYGASLRYFGDTDGGTWKGAGSYSYSVGTEEFYQGNLQTLKTALGIDYWTLDPWWSKLIDWHIWHWRSDGTFHNQNDGLRLARTREQTQIHAIMVANHEGDTALGRRAWWLNKEIEYQSTISSPPAYAIWGPYHIHNVLHRPINATVFPETYPLPYEPTTDGTGSATYGTSQMKIFNRAKKIIWRSGWQTSTSMTASGQRFTSGHSHRDGGHIELCVNRVPILGRHGYYDTGQRQTWQNRAEVNAVPQVLTNSGHTFSYYHRACAQSVMRIQSSSELANNTRDSFQYQFSGDSFFGSKASATATTKDYSQIGDQLWPHDELLTKYIPQDLAHWLSRAYWSYETIDFSEETSVYAYVVLNLKNHYWSGKCTRYKRHILYIKYGQVKTAWRRPIILVWDDLATPIDPTYGVKTTIQQWQVLKKPPAFAYGAGNALGCQITRGTARLQMQWLKPANAPYQTVDGFSDGNIVYPPSRTDPCSDSKIADEVARIEVWQPTATATPQYLTILYPYGNELDAETPPTPTLTEDASWIGVTFTAEEKLFQFAKGDTHSLKTQSTEDPLPPPTKPSPPTGLVATGGSNEVVVDWADNAEADLSYYKLYRRSKTGGGSYSAWSLLVSPTLSTHTDSTTLDGITYQYKVTAVNTGLLESDDSAISNEVTPETPPPPPPDPPPLPPAYDNRKLSVGQHMCSCTLPVPTADAVMDEGDKFQFMFVYSGIDAEAPPIDYTTGSEIPLPDGAGGSCLIDATTGQSGTTIESAEPSAPATGQEIEDAVV